jgi:hypothetical protein
MALSRCDLNNEVGTGVCYASHADRASMVEKVYLDMVMVRFGGELR